MTESEVRAVVMPLLKQAKTQGAEAMIEAIRLAAPLLAQRTAASAQPPAQHFSEFGREPDRPDEDTFSADDVPNIGKYYAADEDGSYPGHLHRRFKCSVKQFAERAGLLQQLVTVERDGKHRRSWRWVKPQTVAEGGKKVFAAPQPHPDPEDAPQLFPNPEDSLNRWAAGFQDRTLPREEIAPFVQQMLAARDQLQEDALGRYRTAGPTEIHNASAHTVAALHDRLEDADDPRAAIIAGHPGNPNFAASYPYSKAEASDRHGNYYQIVPGTVHEPESNPAAAKVTGPGQHRPRVRIYWSPEHTATGETPSKFNITNGFTAVLHPHAAHRIISALPEEARKPLLEHLAQHQPATTPDHIDQNRPVKQPAAVGMSQDDQTIRGDDPAPAPAPVPLPAPRTAKQRSGRFTPEQHQLLDVAMQSGDKAGWGALGDHLAENGHPGAGRVLSAYATDNAEGSDRNSVLDPNATSLNLASLKPGAFQYHYAPFANYANHILVGRRQNGTPFYAAVTDHNDKPAPKTFADPPPTPKGEGGAGHEQLAHMLRTFQSPEHAITRGGGDQADHLVRGQLADALQDQGRESEGMLLRDPAQHVMVHQGQVVPAAFTGNHIVRAQHAAEDAIRLAHGVRQEPFLGWNHIRQGIASVSHPEGIGQPNLQMPLSELGNHLADRLGATIDPGISPEVRAILDRRLQAVRTAPFEEHLATRFPHLYDEVQRAMNAGAGPANLDEGPDTSATHPIRPHGFSAPVAFADYFAEPLPPATPGVTVGPGVASKHMSGETMFTHPYHDAAGQKIGVAKVIPRNDGNLLHVEWVGPEGAKPGEGRGTLGTGTTRAVLKQLVGHYPKATLLSGLHVAGTGEGKTKEQQRVMREIPGRNFAEEPATAQPKQGPKLLHTAEYAPLTGAISEARVKWHQQPHTSSEQFPTDSLLVAAQRFRKAGDPRGELISHHADMMDNMHADDPAHQHVASTRDSRLLGQSSIPLADGTRLLVRTHGHNEYPGVHAVQFSWEPAGSHENYGNRFYGTYNLADARSLADRFAAAHRATGAAIHAALDNAEQKGEPRWFSDTAPDPTAAAPPPRVARQRSGRFTPEQHQLLDAAMSTGDDAAWGVLGDHLAENGHPGAGRVLSAYATEAKTGADRNSVLDPNATTLDLASLKPGAFQYHYAPFAKYANHILVGRHQNGTPFYAAVTDHNDKPAPKVFAEGDLYSHEDFHRKIAENPLETTSALVYADFLDEEGHPEAADIIRRHVEHTGRGAHTGSIPGSIPAGVPTVGPVDDFGHEQVRVRVNDGVLVDQGTTGERVVRPGLLGWSAPPKPKQPVPAAPDEVDHNAPQKPPATSHFADEPASDNHPAAAHLAAIDAALDKGHYHALPALASGLARSKPEPQHIRRFQQYHLPRLLRSWSTIESAPDAQLNSLGIRDRAAAKAGIDGALDTLRKPLSLPDELFAPEVEEKPPLSWKPNVAHPKPHLFTDNAGPPPLPETFATPEEDPANIVKHSTGGVTVYTLTKGGVPVAHLAGWGKSDHFDIFVAHANPSHRGSGLFQKFMASVASQYPKGLSSAKFQTSKSFAKAMSKMPGYADLGRSHSVTSPEQPIPIEEHAGSYPKYELEDGDHPRYPSPSEQFAQDPAVGHKIAKIEDEGIRGKAVPQKQAVAIALDMERRGELHKHAEPAPQVSESPQGAELSQFDRLDAIPEPLRDQIADMMEANLADKATYLKLMAEVTAGATIPEGDEFG